MIVAQFEPTSGPMVFVRFAEPNEEFGNKPFFPVQSMEEAERRHCFRKRMYIVEKMRSWLNQRRHADTLNRKEIDLVLDWIFEVEKKGYYHICDFIVRRRPYFESFAPSEKSRCYPYYKNTIVAILDFCQAETKDLHSHD